MHKVLIANRGEIAVRIARACDDLGIATVAVYADADADALHVQMASEAYALLGSGPAETYLDGVKILEIAARAGCDAIHPGYGFLAENADFAQQVLDAGLTWVGPPPQAIRALGDKITARKIALRAGAPLVPGSDGAVKSAGEIREFAEQYGLPIVIKAAFGGGGRGLKVVRDGDEIDEAFASAAREAMAAFGRDECFVEKFLDRPRHVEAQILADQHGNVIVVGTRDCTLQRRSQKLIEEAPAPFLNATQLEKIYVSAKAISREAEYRGAGTVEYLIAEDGTVVFLEVNTRLQVEHTITEETTGVDLVQAQLLIADGEPLVLTSDPEARGHSFEFRINAEDVGRGFLPSPGTIDTFVAPTGPGIRLDSGVRSGSVVPEQFDSLLAKLIVTGADRDQALRRARRALAEFEISGVATVLPFHRLMVEEAAFTANDRFGVYTTWIENEFSQSIPADPEFNPVPPDTMRRTVTIDVDGRRMTLGLPMDILKGLIAPQDPRAEPEPAGAAVVAELRSSVSGTVVKWLVQPGEPVDLGAAVLVVEAMKMEATVVAPRAGKLGDQLVTIGESVTAGTLISLIM